MISKLTQRLLEGIRPGPKGFDIDFGRDMAGDVINLVSDNTRQPRDNNGVIRYSPFAFAAGADEAHKSALRLALKTFDVDRLHGTVVVDGEPQYAFEELVDEGARRFVQKAGVSRFSMAITPHPVGSGSPLANHMLASLQQVADIGATFHGGIIKASLEAIGVDARRLRQDLDQTYDKPVADKYYAEVVKQVERAKRTGAFKIRDVMGQWRKYVAGFLRVNAVGGPDLIRALCREDLLPIVFIDDYNTTGATIAEAVRLIREQAPEAVVYAYTLCRSH